MEKLRPGLAYRVHDTGLAEEMVFASMLTWQPGGPPIRLVVPSHSLRLYWLQLLTRRHGSVLGVEVVTHHQLVRNILQASQGIRLPSAEWARQVARVEAAEQPVLARSLDHLDDGYGIAAQAMEDLVEAGVRGEHVDALSECMRTTTQAGGTDLPGGVGPRVCALLGALSNTFKVLGQSDSCWPAEYTEGAIEALRRDPKTCLPASQIFVLGYSDATCAVADLIQALCRNLSATVLVNVPMSPTRPSDVDTGIAFAQSFLDRFEGLWGPPIVGTGLPKPALIEAKDPYREAAIVAGKIGALIDNGTDPGTIGVVVRELSSWALPIRRVFRDHAIQFAGMGSSTNGKAGERQLAALADCFRDGDRADVGRWLQTLHLEAEHRVLLYLEASGVRRVSDICDRIQEPKGDVRLRVRIGFEEREGSVRGRRAVVPADVVRMVRNAAKHWCNHWQKWSNEDQIGGHCGAFEAMLLGPARGRYADQALEVLATLLSSLPKNAVVSRGDFLRIVCGHLRASAKVPVGTGIGGVLVMDAMEARGRRFEHLFVMGMTRGSFPRVVTEDPMLPDACRRILRQIVPDIREKKLGADEERFLFALLMGASPSIHLSYSHNDVANKPNHPSSIVVNLRLHDRLNVCKSETIELPQWQRSALASIQGSDEHHGLPNHLQSIWKARRGTKGAHLPYLGWIGPPVHPRDPRHNTPFVTTLESHARCPWGAHLGRDLSVRERSNPWGKLPAINNHLIGRVVHAVIERSILACRTNAVPGHPVPMRWPSGSTLDDWATQAAKVCLREDGHAWVTLAPAVVPFVREAVSELQQMDGPELQVVAAEHSMEWVSPDGVPVQFRVDRVEQAQGKTRYTDFKLGKPPTALKTEAARKARILEMVRDGRLLQGPLYGLAKEDGSGCYMHLAPKEEYPERVFSFDGSDSPSRDAFLDAFHEIGSARLNGVLFPDLQHVRSGKAACGCEYCRIRETTSSAGAELQLNLLEKVVIQSRTSNVLMPYRMWWRSHGGRVEE